MVACIYKPVEELEALVDKAAQPVQVEAAEVVEATSPMHKAVRREQE